MIEEGVTLSQYTAMSVLAVRPGLSNAQLARRSFVTPQGMNQAIAVLADEGLVRRVPHASNGRVLCIELTAQGEDVLARCEAKIDTFENELLGELGERERGALNRTLARLAAVDRGHDKA